MTLPWEERVPMLSINPAAGTEPDVERLATELIEANARIAELERELTDAEYLVALHREEIDTVCDMLGIDRNTTIDKLTAVLGSRLTEKDKP